MRILTLCGSLRRNSSNRALLQAYEKLAPAEMRFFHYEEAAHLPHFNPDLDRDPLPPEVKILRNCIAEADVLLISTPEYVHALPGAFKNILDWLVSDPAFAGKPVALLHVAKGSFFALESLKEVLATMSARVLKSSSVLIPLESNQIDCDSFLARENLRKILLESIGSLPQEIREGRSD